MFDAKEKDLSINNGDIYSQETQRSSVYSKKEDKKYSFGIFYLFSGVMTVFALIGSVLTAFSSAESSFIAIHSGTEKMEEDLVNALELDQTKEDILKLSIALPVFILLLAYWIKKCDSTYGKVKKMTTMATEKIKTRFKKQEEIDENKSIIRENISNSDWIHFSANHNNPLLNYMLGVKTKYPDYFPLLSQVNHKINKEKYNELSSKVLNILNDAMTNLRNTDEKNIVKKVLENYKVESVIQLYQESQHPQKAKNIISAYLDTISFYGSTLGALIGEIFISFASIYLLTTTFIPNEICAYILSSLSGLLTLFLASGIIFNASTISANLKLENQLTEKKSSLFVKLPRFYISIVASAMSTFGDTLTMYTGLQALTSDVFFQRIGMIALFYPIVAIAYRKMEGTMNNAEKFLTFHPDLFAKQTSQSRVGKLLELSATFTKILASAMLAYGQISHLSFDQDGGKASEIMINTLIKGGYIVNTIICSGLAAYLGLKGAVDKQEPEQILVNTILKEIIIDYFFQNVSQLPKETDKAYKKRIELLTKETFKEFHQAIAKEPELINPKRAKVNTTVSFFSSANPEEGLGGFPIVEPIDFRPQLQQDCPI